MHDLPTPIPFAGLPGGPKPVDELLAQGGEAWAAFYAANMPVSAAMRRRLMANDFAAVRARFKGLHENNIARHMDGVQTPCLIFVGENEAAYGGAKQLAGLLAHAKFVAFPGLNHFDMFARLDVVLPEALSFLAQVR